MPRIPLKTLSRYHVPLDLVKFFRDRSNRPNEMSHPVPLEPSITGRSEGLSRLKNGSLEGKDMLLFRVTPLDSCLSFGYEDVGRERC